MMKRAVTQASRAAVRVARRNNALLASPRMAAAPALQSAQSQRSMATEAKSGAVGQVRTVIGAVVEYVMLQYLTQNMC